VDVQLRMAKILAPVQAKKGVRVIQVVNAKAVLLIRRDALLAIKPNQKT